MRGSRQAQLEADAVAAALSFEGMKSVPEAALSLVVSETVQTTDNHDKEVIMSDEKTPIIGDETPRIITMTVDEYEKVRQEPVVTETEAPEMSAADAIQADRKRCRDIQAKCTLAGIPREKADTYIDAGLSMSAVEHIVEAHMVATNTPASNGGQDESDENAAYRAEYNTTVAGGVAMACSEDEYVNVRRREDGKDPIEIKEGV